MSRRHMHLSSGSWLRSRGRDSRHLDALGTANYEGSGLVQLHPEEAAASAEADIVLVAGLGGHHSRTWEGADLTLWPRDLLPPKISKRIRIRSFRYNTTLQGTVSEAGIGDHAKELLDELSSDREDDEAAALRPLIFVGHSLGGMIIKKALFLAHKKTQTRFRPLWDASRGIMFFSTPHLGLDPALWRKFVKHVLPFDAPVTGALPSYGMLREIENDGDVLYRITEDFKPQHPELSFVTFIEETPMKGMERVLVDKVYGLMHAHTEYHSTLSGDHLSICQFAKSQEGAFKPVASQMEFLLGRKPKVLDRAGYEAKRALYSLCPNAFHCYFLDRQPTKGTCGWIAERQEFQGWLANKPGSERLWISGQPGCGKSFLAKHIITELIPSPYQEDVIHCFLSDTLPSRGNIQALLRATLHQALRLEPELVVDFLMPTFSEAQRRDVGDQDIWTRDVLVLLWAGAMAQIAKRRALIMVIDGIDEIGPECRETFFSCLEELGAKMQDPSRTRVLLISRNEGQIKEHLDKQGFKTYLMKPEDTEMDMLSTVNDGLGYLWNHTRYNIEDLEGSRDGQDDIGSIIAHRSGGVYLWIILVPEILRRDGKMDESRMAEKVRGFPQSIEGLYGHTLGGMHDRRRDTAAFIRQALTWAVFQQRGLKVAELNTALALAKASLVSPGQTVTPQGLASFLDDNIKAKLNFYCGQLVKFHDGRLTLVHRSLKTYLTTATATSELGVEFFLDQQSSHAVLASVCVMYLTMAYFCDSCHHLEATEPSYWETKVRKRIREHGFVRYAALYWFKHVAAAGPKWPGIGGKDSLDRKMLLEDDSTEYAKCWTEVWWFLTRGATQQPYPHGVLARSIVAQRLAPAVSAKAAGGLAPPPPSAVASSAGLVPATLVPLAEIVPLSSKQHLASTPSAAEPKTTDTHPPTLVTKQRQVTRMPTNPLGTAGATLSKTPETTKKGPRPATGTMSLAADDGVKPQPPPPPSQQQHARRENYRRAEQVVEKPAVPETVVVEKIVEKTVFVEKPAITETLVVEKTVETTVVIDRPAVRETVFIEKLVEVEKPVAPAPPPPPAPRGKWLRRIKNAGKALVKELAHPT
ncbi:hypothetical protein B0T26DRAFT_807175 [Lasiosphaeria miniovina]|uniref:NACHT domain-containing protein n=1 Tax=Lasiosphaeria miniovina TaxID=1954250 RepID=A0AA39ZTY0_9PEZI|nr:uncharacterized protein B0T26DRAFT_807175 [Lasiosphaeria miniovina]KAK0703666.1 hypothetical protein B0T26DRAFT_807175 [Lasiosphaeria miniovina]